MIYKVEFSNGKTIEVKEFNSGVMTELQTNGDIVVSVDGQPVHLWNDYNSDVRKEAIKIKQANCKHDKGYITNTGMSPSKCVLCGKPLY